jgi:hypothetical protein
MNEERVKEFCKKHFAGKGPITEEMYVAALATIPDGPEKVALDRAIAKMWNEVLRDFKATHPWWNDSYPTLSDKDLKAGDKYATDFMKDEEIAGRFEAMQKGSPEYCEGWVRGAMYAIEAAYALFTEFKDESVDAIRVLALSKAMTVGIYRRYLAADRARFKLPGQTS